ncbi:Deoxyguanosinetriphosphate triphosphohydrolase-like protein [Candidatus Methanobinarius endosymbioticus]|uniref:Deoxyguanosinetriphosphate triphosphohydrolase-like protein n=1 Tax=Candidatus Methanobinarius endosymbioticus TaxID=2006182 RepID=A0A366MAC9_9EURY|nr:Deoxyguanosinetriphosphate triphosphohydrolase-like protein [Candidatus Methanobinarius endosymbioticus]
MPDSTKFLRDSVHGNVSLNEFEVKVMDSPQIQRLRRIKQLGFISLVYPGANHSRLEHSIGTMFLGSKLANHLELSDYNKKLVRIAALLHDAGHGPFSHVSEAVSEVKHEVLTAKVIEETSLNDIISKEFDPKEIIDIVNGKGPLGPIVSGELDVDRMDYLIRDSHYTGVAYGVIDADRIIANLKLKQYLILDIKGVQAAEEALVARYQMYPSVYQHHTTRIVNAMFRRCLKRVFNEGLVDSKDMYKYDDSDMLCMCRNVDETESKDKKFIKDIITRLDNRNLLKSVCSTRLNEFENPQEVFKIDKKALDKCEEDIGEDMDIDKDYVILNIPEYPRFDEMKTQMALGDELFHLNEISSIVKALQSARFNYPDICLYVSKEDRHKFKNFKLDNYLDLPEKLEKKFDTVHVEQSKLLE